jgi:TIR domain
MGKPAKKQNSKKASPRPRQRKSDKVNVFISYSHDDFPIAQALWREIEAIDHAGFDVFLDAEKIQLGSDWKDEIARAVKKSDIFIAVYTGDQKHVFDYCGFEVGLFTASERAGMKRRMFCIYDTREPPTILSGLQGVQISYDAGETLLKTTEGWISDAFAPRLKGVFALCYKLYTERRGVHLQDQGESKAREIIQAFYVNKGDELIDERPLHERISITLPAVTDWDTMTGIPPTSRVMGIISSFSLLGIPNAVPQRVKDQDIYALEWKELVELLTKRAGNVVPWIRYVEASILAQLKAGVAQPPPLSFIGEDTKPYRPIIGRFKVFRNGTRRYYVSLIPTLERLFPGRDETSFPLIGLIFAARFWFKFGEERQKAA